jgi:hypothetical protein
VITTAPCAGWVTDWTAFGPPSLSVSLASTSTAVAVASSAMVLVSSTATGASSTSVTVIVKAFSTNSPAASVARTRIDRAGVVSWSRTAAVRSDEPLIEKEELSLPPVPVTRVKA